MGWKLFQLVHEDSGAAVTSASFVFVDIENVVVFRKAVKAEYPNKLAHVDAGDLVVFASRAAYDEKQAALALTESIESLGGSLEDAKPENALIVQVPMDPSIPRIAWTAAPADACLPPLVVRKDDRFIHLPPSSVDGSGLGRAAGRRHGLMLCCRPALVKQWNEINRCSIQTYALLWVVGPPGSGKSCAALAFAWSLDRGHWDVLWIHHSREDDRFNCMRLLDNNKKETCVIQSSTEVMVDRELRAILNATSKTKKTIVFLDGYVKSSKAAEAARLLCKEWHEQDKIQHRLVCVCSMVAVGKDYRSDLYRRIPTTVGDQDSEDAEMVTVEQQEDAQAAWIPPLKTQMLFRLTSWRLEEYKQAVLDDAFFHNVKVSFPQYPAPRADPEQDPNERLQLVDEKYFVAGGSARLMFDLTTEEAMGSLSEAIAPHTRHRNIPAGPDPFRDDVRLVSDYVVREFAMLMGPRLLEKFARACNVNPSIDGFVLEAWFFAALTHTGLKWKTLVESKWQSGNWRRSNVIVFDANMYPLRVQFESPTWMAPCLWNQGGYDAVFVDKATVPEKTESLPTYPLVRFVQVTRAQKHFYDPIHFVKLLNSLVASGLAKVAMVELYFVVPMANVEAFLLPVSTEDFQRNVIEVATSEERTLRSSIADLRPFQHCQAKVMVIGVDYEMADRYPVEGSQVGKRARQESDD